MAPSNPNSGIDAIFLTPPMDGIGQLPQKPGIYAMLNRVTRLINIEQKGIRGCKVPTSQPR